MEQIKAAIISINTNTGLDLSGELPGAIWGYSLQCGVRILLTLSLNAAFSFSLTSGCLR